MGVKKADSGRTTEGGRGGGGTACGRRCGASGGEGGSAGEGDMGGDQGAAGGAAAEDEEGSGLPTLANVTVSGILCGGGASDIVSFTAQGIVCLTPRPLTCSAATKGSSENHCPFASFCLCFFAIPPRFPPPR